MEKFLEKFSLYEFFVYFIPGTSLLGILILQDFYNLDCIDYKEYSLFFTFVLLFIGYFLGIIVHEIGELLQKHFVFKGNKLPSYTYVQKESAIFSETEIESYKKFAQNKYNIDINDPQNADLFFQRLRTELKNTDKYNEAEIINNNYGICRSYLALSAVLTIILLPNLFFYFSILNIATYILNIVVVFILCRRLKRFGQTYVKKVLRLGFAKLKED